MTHYAFRPLSSAYCIAECMKQIFLFMSKILRNTENKSQSAPRFFFTEKICSMIVCTVLTQKYPSEQDFIGCKSKEACFNKINEQEEHETGQEEHDIKSGIVQANHTIHWRNRSSKRGILELRLDLAKGEHGSHTIHLRRSTRPPLELPLETGCRRRAQLQQLRADNQDDVAHAAAASPPGRERHPVPQHSAAGVEALRP